MSGLTLEIAENRAAIASAMFDRAWDRRRVSADEVLKLRLRHSQRVYELDKARELAGLPHPRYNALDAARAAVHAAAARHPDDVVLRRYARTFP